MSGVHLLLQTHYLYTLWDADEECLYVGATSDIPARLSVHRRGRSWWPSVARIDVATYPTKAAAHEAEAARIRELQPAHNHQHTSRALGPWSPERRAAHGEALRRARERHAAS